MERLDFASVMAVLRRNIPDENFGNQADFLDSLFLDMGFSPQTAMEFDQGQVCRWINGLARLSPNIISFYQDSFNQRKLVSRIKNMLLPMMPDSAMASQDQFLDVMLKYRCRILFTTRRRYENHISHVEQPDCKILITFLKQLEFLRACVYNALMYRYPQKQAFTT